MPYVPVNPDDEEKKNLGAPEDIAGTDSAGLGGEGAKLSPQQSGMSGWTNVKAYLDANKDQSLGMAQNLSGKLGGEADALKGSIDSGEKDFEGNVDQNKVDFDQATVDNALANPADFVKDDANVGKFTKMRDASYKGPTDLTGTGQYGELQAKINEGQSRAGNIDTEGGRQALLFEGPGNPTKGQVTLDSLLISGSPESRDVLKQGAGKFGTLQAYLDEQAGKGAGYAASAKAATEAAAKNTKDRLDASTTAFQTDLDTRLAAARSNAKTAQDKLNDNFFNGGTGTPQPKLTPEDYTTLGLSETELNPIFQSLAPLRDDYDVNADLHPFLTMENPDALYASRGDVAGDEDFAKAAALAKLSGADNFLTPGTGIKGTGVNFDRTGAAGATSEALRNLDIQTLQGILNQSPTRHSLTDLADPSLQASIRGQLTGKQLKQFDDALQRLNLTARPPTTPTNDPDDGSGGTVGFGNRGLPGTF